MSKRLIVSAFLITGLVFACGGGSGGTGSGLPGTKKVVDLTTGEIDQFCTFVVAAFPTRTITCGTQMVMFGSDKASCISKAPSPSTTPNCAATVAQSEACFDALGALTDAQVCTFIGGGPAPTACAAVDTPECSTAG
jgi:hypothetical protein